MLTSASSDAVPASPADPQGEQGGSRRPLKLAVLGKGGVGKTALVSLLVRAISERGFMVLAVDLDANPGLAVSLGVPPADTPLPEEAVEPRPDTPFGWGLARHLTPAECVRRYALPAAPRVAFLGFGNNAGLDTPVPQYLTAVREVAEGFEEPGWVVVADLGAGPTTPFEGYARFASLALVAVEATATSILTARHLTDILRDDATPAKVVITKSRGPEDVAEVRRQLEPFGTVPFDEEVQRLERKGSLAELPDTSPALGAVREMVARLGL